MTVWTHVINLILVTGLTQSLLFIILLNLQNITKYFLFAEIYYHI